MQPGPGLGYRHLESSDLGSRPGTGYTSNTGYSRPGTGYSRPGTGYTGLTDLTDQTDLTGYSLPKPIETRLATLDSAPEEITLWNAKTGKKVSFYY